MRQFGVAIVLVLVTLSTSAIADPLTCKAASDVVFRSSKTIISGEMALDSLFSDLDTATDNKDLSRVKELVGDITSRCGSLVQAAREANEAADAMSSHSDRCGADQAEIDKIHADMSKEISDCTSILDQVGKD